MEPLMELRHLSTFRVVAMNGSFTRAALALGYAQSSVTAHIQALEAELGVPLFDRLGKQIVLTAAGRRCPTYATQLLDLAEEARTTATAGDEPTGMLTISAPETLCTYRLPVLLRLFRDRFPRVRLVFRPARPANLRRYVREGEIDIAFTLDEPLQAPNLRVEPLVPEPVVLVAPPDHALAPRSSVRPADLIGESMLLTEAGCAYRDLFERALAAAGVAPRDTMEFGSVEAIKQCVIAGMGLAVLPAVAVARELTLGQLVALRWAESPLEVVTQMVWHAERWQSPALRAFLELARETLATMGAEHCAEIT